jgi:hypothetical protein
VRRRGGLAPISRQWVGRRVLERLLWWWWLKGVLRWGMRWTREEDIGRIGWVCCASFVGLDVPSLMNTLCFEFT